MEIASKSEFARIIGVTPQRVSQLISEGKITPAEMLGEGRSAKIRVDQAMQALKLRLDAGQRNGNGLKTQLHADVPAAAPIAVEVQAPPEAQPAARSASVVDEIDLGLKKAKLEEAALRNERLQEEKKARAGTYVLAEHVRTETSKLASLILQMFEAGMAEIATEMAATYKLPQRDVIHMMRTRYRDVRTKVSAKLADEALSQSEIFEDQDLEQ
jgi:hypothetical protein